MSCNLPSGWTLAVPQDLAAPERNSLGIGPFGSDLKVSDYSESGIPLVFVRNIRSERFHGAGTKYVSAAKAKELEAHEVRPGDVLITKMGEPPGDSTIYPASRPVGIVTADCIRWRIDPKAGEPRFFAYATKSAEVRSRIAAITQGVAQRKVSLARFKTIHYRVAPVPEQGRIVEALDSYFTRLDDAEATLERVQRNLKRYRASVLKAAVEGRLVPTEAELARAEGRDYEPASVLLERILAERRRRWEEAELAKVKARGRTTKDENWKATLQEPEPLNVAELPKLPEGWVWASVDAVGDVLLGRQRAPQYLTGRYSRPYLRVANIKDDRIDFSDLEEMDFDPTHFEKYCLRPGDILLSEGQSPELLGQSAIYRGDVEGLCFQKTLHRFRPVPGGPGAEFAQLVFRSHVKSGLFKKLGSITTNIAHLTLVKFKGAPFPLPPAREQERITVETRRILSIIDEIEAAGRRQVSLCHRLRQSILKWAFEGRLADQDPTDEPASVLLDRIRAEREAAPGRRSRSPRRTSPRREFQEGERRSP